MAYRTPDYPPEPPKQRAPFRLDRLLLALAAATPLAAATVGRYVPHPAGFVVAVLATGAMCMLAYGVMRADGWKP
jgi:hypothetical protein